MEQKEMHNHTPHRTRFIIIIITIFILLGILVYLKIKENKITTEDKALLEAAEENWQRTIGIGLPDEDSLREIMKLNNQE